MTEIREINKTCQSCVTWTVHEPLSSWNFLTQVSLTHEAKLWFPAKHLKSQTDTHFQHNVPTDTSLALSLPGVGGLSPTDHTPRNAFVVF